MRIEAEYSYPAAPRDVWNLLLSPESLQSCIPGVETLTETGTDSWEAALRVQVAAIKGNYKAKIAIVEKDEFDAYTLNVEGAGGPGFVKGSARITLTADGEGTKVSVVADGQVGGMVAGVGQRMLTGVAKMLTNQFFECLKKRLPAE